MRKTVVLLFVLCLPLLFGVTAFAADTAVSITPTTDSGDATVVNWGEPSGETSPDVSDTGGGAAAVPVRDAGAEAYPQSVEETTENGVAIVRKTYELAPGDDPQTLVQEFEQDGIRFICREILRRELPGETLTRQAAKTAVTETESDDESEIMPHFPDSIDFEDGGYSGKLYLDADTIRTEASDYESYSYATVETREVPGLDRNDPSYLDKEWNGMALTGVSFKQGADGLYTATASYTGRTSGQKETGFVTTAAYRGDITMTEPGNILYTVVYEGEPVVVPPEPTEPEPTEAASMETVPTDAATLPELPAVPAEDTAPVSPGMTGYVVVGLVGILLGAAGVKLLPRLRPNNYKREEDDNEA